MESKKNNRGKKNPRISGPDKRDVLDSNITWPIRELEDRTVKIEGKIYSSVGDYTADNIYDSDTTGLGLGFFAHKRDEKFNNYTERKEYGKRKRKRD